MLSKILYTETIKHYLFKENTSEDIKDLIEKIEEYYTNSIIAQRKVWSNYNYLNSVIFNFLICNDKLRNKEPIFLALIFKYSFSDEFVISESNADSFNYFIEFLSCYKGNIDLYKYKNSVKLFLTFDFFIDNDSNITNLDYTYYQDILYYSAPISFFDNIYTCYYDDENLSVVNYHRSIHSLNRSLTFIEIFNILQEITNKTKYFKTDFFQKLHKQKSSQLMEYYKRISKQK